MCFNKIIEKQFGFLPCIIEECSSCEKYEKRWELPLQKKSAYYDCPLCDSFCSGGLQQ